MEFKFRRANKKSFSKVGKTRLPTFQKAFIREKDDSALVILIDGIIQVENIVFPRKNSCIHCFPCLEE